MSLLTKTPPIVMNLAGLPIRLEEDNPGEYYLVFDLSSVSAWLELKSKRHFRGESNPLVILLLERLQIAGPVPGTGELSIPVFPGYPEAWNLAHMLLKRAYELDDQGFRLVQRKAKRKEAVLSLWDGYTSHVDGVNNVGIWNDALPYGIAHGFYLVLEEKA